MTASGTTVYPGLYRARCTADDGVVLTVFVPQVFGTQPITTSDLTGARPSTGDWGYISFEGGDVAFPVWVSTGGGSSVTASPTPDVAWALDIHDPGTTVSEGVTTTIKDLSIVVPAGYGVEANARCTIECDFSTASDIVLQILETTGSPSTIGIGQYRLTSGTFQDANLGDFPLSAIGVAPVASGGERSFRFTLISSGGDVTAPHAAFTLHVTQVPA